MKQRIDPFTLLLVTAVTLLIWYGAAGETRTSETFDLTLRFVPGDAGRWRITPNEREITVTAEGSARALRGTTRIDALVTEPPLASGSHQIDTLEHVARHPLIADAAVVITDVHPAAIAMRVDEIVREPALVTRTLTGITTIDDPQIEPREVIVAMPRSVRANFPETLAVEPILDPEDLASLAPGRRHTLDGVRLRLIGGRGSAEDVAITPPSVRITIALQSRTATHQIDRPVRIQLQAPPEDEGVVRIDPIQLRDVTVEGPVELIDEIRAGTTRVLAVVILKSTEREARLDRKRVSHFLAERADGTAHTIKGWVESPTGRDDRPEVSIRIAADEGPES